MTARACLLSLCPLAPLFQHTHSHSRSRAKAGSRENAPSLHLFSPPAPLHHPHDLRLLAGGWDKNSSVGRHASSQLTQTVAVEGLADAFMAFNTNYHDSGLFGVYGVTDRWVAYHRMPHP